LASARFTTSYDDTKPYKLDIIVSTTISELNAKIYKLLETSFS
jgi:hypothetical protein